MPIQKRPIWVGCTCIDIIPCQFSPHSCNSTQHFVETAFWCLRTQYYHLHSLIHLKIAVYTNKRYFHRIQWRYVGLMNTMVWMWMCLGSESWFAYMQWCSSSLVSDFDQFFKHDFQEIYWHMSTNPNAHGVNHHYIRRLQTQILKGEPRWHWWWCRNLGVIRWYTWYQATHRFCEFISNSTVYKQYREL